MRNEAVISMEKEQYFTPDGRGNIREEVVTKLATENIDDDLRFILENLQTKIDTDQLYPTEVREKGRWIPKFALLVVSGMGSVGNSSTVLYSAESYGIPSDQIFQAGEKFREYDDKMKPDHPEHDSVAFIDRPDHLDKLVDEMILKKIMEASVEKPIIIEAKLGGALLRYLEQQAKILGVDLPAPRAAILKWADSKKRLEIARRKKSSSGVDVMEIRKQSSDRILKDMEKWCRIHPWLRDFKNILGKDARDNEGNPLYQDFVDASDHSGPEEDFDDLNEKLVRLGLVIENKGEEMKEGRSIFMGYRPWENDTIIGDEDPGY